MNEQTKPTLAEQRERLALACRLDRLNLRLAMRPTPLERLSLAVLEKAAPLIPYLPGRIGRWARGIAQGTNLFRGVYEAVFN
jgi:hypothetical protein